MQIIDNIIILSLPVLAFIAGIKLADKYYSRIIAEYQYTQKLLTIDRGFGYIAPPQAQEKCVPIGQPFMDRLRETGHATQALRSKTNSHK